MRIPRALRSAKRVGASWCRRCYATPPPWPQTGEQPTALLLPDSMDDMDDMENEDIAAAMGFASFGGTKKRKYDQANSPKSKPDASGANVTRLGVRSKVEHGQGHHANLPDQPVEPEARDPAPLAQQPRASKPKQNQKQPAATGLAAFLSRGKELPERPVQQDQHPPTLPNETPHASVMVSFGGPAISQAELSALRSGVPDGNGDRAYFLPSFVQDPWEAWSKSPS